MKLLSMLRNSQVYFYLLHSAVHWQEREDAISEVLDEVIGSNDGEQIRLLDIGCGPGLLVDMALRRGAVYLGLDTDSASIDYCRNKYKSEERVSFSTLTIPSEEIVINSCDIIVLNGVMHHLNDDEVKTLLRNISAAKLVIVADHYRDNKVGSWVKFLQRRDRGKYVRDFTFFNSLDGYRVEKSLVFPIRLLFSVFWMYFCIAYTPDVKAVVEEDSVNSRST